MVMKKTVNAKNLEAFGAERLAELLIEISGGNAVVKRRLRLELAGAQNPAALAREIRKRLATMARSRTFVDWRSRRALADDLETQRRAIIEQAVKVDVAEALDLTWGFLALANSIFERCDDSSGTMIGIFGAATSDLGELAKTANTDPKGLADHAFQALIENNYGQFDYLISALRPALGEDGLEHLKQRMIALSREPVKKLPEKERRKIGWSSAGPIYEDDIANRHQASAIHLALKEIADAQGDVDSFIAQYDRQTRKVPRIAAQIARRLLAAGRTEEALRMIGAAEHARSDWPGFEWEDARIDVLDALGRCDDTQAARWLCFERSLSSMHLRAYLKGLPDFDDVEVETRAFDYAEKNKVPLRALSSLASWPALDRATNLVINRSEELNGDEYEILTPAANALAGKHPLAATLLLRAMVDFSLDQGRTSRYKHASRHLLECASLALSIQDFGKFGTHEAFVEKLRAKHGKKGSFWSLVS
ncbi:MAG: DUF6880 family protein [Roseiarcus sp.]